MTSPDADHAARLLRLFGEPPANWVRETGVDHDVLVVGAGQAGLAIGFGLRRAGIARASVIDAAPAGGKGVWTTVARMRRLRTPKAWPEPEFGFPELSFRAWFEQREGEAAYDALDRIPRLVWADYLDWVEQVVSVPVRHRTRLLDVVPGRDHLVLHLETRDDHGGSHRTTETTRSLVLANGVEGTGGPAYPSSVRDLPPHLLRHTGDAIDFHALNGRRVAVIGAGASALDAVGAALEAGAAQAHLFVRRPDLIIQGPGGFPPGSLGARENFHRRSDAERWRLKHDAARAGRSCTVESVQRAAAHAGFHLHLGTSVLSAHVAEDRVRLHASDGLHDVDLVIAGTGYQYDPATSPVLSGIAGEIALWGDRYQPPLELVDEGLASWPYLGEGYELQEKHAGTAPWLHRIRVFSAASAMSFGLPVGDVASLATGVPRLVDAIGRDLFFEDQALPPASAGAGAGAPTSYRSVYEHAIWTPARDDDSDLQPVS